LVAGLVMGVEYAGVGQVGDLLMSLLKRDAGLKDAGRSLPGFGGVLDVLDSVLLVAPVAFWMLRLVIGGATGGPELLE
jgi:phosphatidate cytidylyltransferase